MRLRDRDCRAIVSFGLLLCVSTLYANEQLVTNQYLDNSLDELLVSIKNATVITSSKKSEELWDAPLSTSVIFRKDIQNAGATTISEALRLIPGIVVNEVANGDLEVFIGGHNYYPSLASLNLMKNRTTLVMVDNREVFNYESGGTFWREIGLKIHDIERIEVVRGAASALYGPNAVSGVIHILTKRPDIESMEPVQVSGGLDAGRNTTISNIALNFRPRNSNWAARVSVSEEQRDRFQDTFYRITRPDSPYLPLSEDFLQFDGVVLSDLTNAYQAGLGPDQASEQRAWNLFFSYQGTSDLGLKFDFDIGRVDVEAYRAYLDTSVTPLIPTDSDAAYLNSQIQIRNFKMQYTQNQGGNTNVVHIPTFESSDYTVRSLLANYTWNLTDYSSLQAEIRKKQILSEGASLGVGEKEMTLDSIALYSDTSIDRWRFIAAINRDKYNIPKTRQISYQLATNYNFSEILLGRAVLARANRIPFVNETLANIVVPTAGSGNFIYTPSDDFNPTTQNSMELGLRGVFFERFIADIGLNYAVVDEHVATITSPIEDDFVIVVSNVPTELEQWTLTSSVEHIVSKKLNMHYYLSLVNADIKDDWDRGAVAVNADLKNPAAPDWFGGIELNYDYTPKLHLNIHAYMADKRTFSRYTRFNVFPIENKKVFLLSSTLGYQASSNWRVQLSGRNLLDTNKVEYYGTDSARRTFLLSINYEPSALR